MKKTIEASGKTVKEAIQRGLAELGCTLDEVEYSVIDMGKPGFFGVFAKPAKVRMTAKDDRAFAIDMPVFSLDQPAQGGNRKRDNKKKPTDADAASVEAPKNEKPEKKSEKKPEKTEKKPEKKAERAQSKPEKPAKPEKSEKSAETEPPKPKKDAKPRNRREKAPRADQPRPEPVTIPAPAEAPVPFVETPEEELSQTARNARDFLQGLTRRMNVPAEIAVMDGEENLRMVLSGENMSILIGRRGETLDAIQYLTSLNINRGRENYLRVTLDTENYRAKREETLRKLAVSKANLAKKSRRKVVLEPMNPNERRILHSALQNDPEVTTHSEGEEPYRRVIITLK